MAGHEAGIVDLGGDGRLHRPDVGDRSGTGVEQRLDEPGDTVGGRGDDPQITCGERIERADLVDNTTGDGVVEARGVAVDADDVPPLVCLLYTSPSPRDA